MFTKRKADAKLPTHMGEWGVGITREVVSGEFFVQDANPEANPKRPLHYREDMEPPPPNIESWTRSSMKSKVATATMSAYVASGGKVTRPEPDTIDLNVSHLSEKQLAWIKRKKVK